jgi:IclR family transcriptional regulator, pca regulon regulatory protein
MDESSPLHEQPETDPADVADSASENPKGARAADPNYMNSLARGLAVILAFTPARRSLSISQISQRTGIPRAAVRRCLLTLEQLGFVAPDDDRHFVLRPRVLSLGHAYLASAPLGRAAQPVLQAIRQQINETASVGILDNDQVLYIARAPAERLMVINLDIGSRLSANCTSIGRVLLSYLAPEALDDHLL